MMMSDITLDLLERAFRQGLNSLKYIFVFLILLQLFACKEFLEEFPTTEVTEADFFQDVESAQLAVNAIYDPLNYGGVGTLLGTGGHSYEFVIGDICTDDAEKGSIDADQIGISQLKFFTANAGNSNVINLWNSYFVIIGRTNLVLRNLENSDFQDQDRLPLMAEARFLRAYSYFNLARIYGGLPLFRSPVTPDQINGKNFQREPLYRVYQLIDEDFAFAMDHLSVKGVREVGRANQGAAAAFAARAIMYQLGTDNTNGHTWQEVLELTERFINGEFGAYDLADNYALIFDTAGENNIESIFEIQSVDNGLSNFDFGPFIGSVWTVFQSPQFMGGWGFNTPTADLVDVFEANDPRRPCTAIGIGEYAYGVEMLTSDRNKTGYYHRKAILHPDEWETEKGSGYNVRKFRYADILLMNAEAAHHQGDFTKAIDRLIQIRNRASQSTFPRGFDPNDPKGFTATGFQALDNSIIPSSGQDLLEFIYLERRRELGMEQLRFWDMVRTGRFVALMSSKYGISAATIEGHAITSIQKEVPEQIIVNPIPVYPIPALEVADWGIQQNPGY